MANALNNAFFESFKYLDQLCCDVYDSSPGVTCYINDMKNTPWNYSRSIANWDEDLRNLMRLPHFRNHLAHDPGAFDELLCVQEDID